MTDERGWKPANIEDALNEIDRLTAEVDTLAAALTKAREALAPFVAFTDLYWHHESRGRGDSVYTTCRPEGSASLDKPIFDTARAALSPSPDSDQGGVK